MEPNFLSTLDHLATPLITHSQFHFLRLKLTITSLLILTLFTHNLSHVFPLTITHNLTHFPTIFATSQHISQSLPMILSVLYLTKTFVVKTLYNYHLHSRYVHEMPNHHYWQLKVIAMSQIYTVAQG